MKRFFGMMPSEEISISKNYKYDNQNYLIDAGSKGWTIIYPDNSTDYKDETKLDVENFNEAFKKLKERYPDVIESEKTFRGER